jgi:hypothetical protein
MMADAIPAAAGFSSSKSAFYQIPSDPSYTTVVVIKLN